MSEFTPSDPNDMNGNGYVDFNQFILQHNFHQDFDSNIQSNDYYGFNYQPMMQYGDHFNVSPDNFDPPPSNTNQQGASHHNDLVVSSNLAPTAAEFVPRFGNLSLNNDDATRFQVQPSTSNPFSVSNERLHRNNDNNNEGYRKNDLSRNSRNTGAIRKNNYYQNRNRNNDQRYSNDSQYQYFGNYYRGNGLYNHNKNKNYENRNLRRRENRKFQDGYGYRNSHDHSEDNSFDNGTNSPKNNGGSSPKNGKPTQDQSEVRVSHAIQIKSPQDYEEFSQREKLIQEIEARKLECLVCVEKIKTHQQIWSCTNCFHIFHLTCITKWAASSKSETGWRCPACQNTTKDVPREYYCFCGKTKNPRYNRCDVAHTCGEVCGRKESCEHGCTLLCHPGPCPPCQATITRKCGCGRTSRMLQCCLKEEFTCEQKCEKSLNCKIHLCEEICHNSKCTDCEKKVDQKCHCGKMERQVACTVESNEKKVFSCGKICNRPLPCGNHKCNYSCHPGECRTCKLSPDVVVTCPCGKTPIEPGARKSCLDPIPLCANVCGKVLKCGQPGSPHHCAKKCHTGQCPPCGKQTSVKCRCGHMSQMIKCRQLSTRADDARCKKRCTKKRNCGKHKCNQECCIDIDHICPLQCNYSLSCGKHKCDQPCHRGNCPPCYRSSFDELYCECGANVIYPPVPCGTKRPTCNQPCSRRHPCTHPVSHNCHSSATCPPCIVFTTQWCYGSHEQRKTIPCSQESFSCGLPCSKQLPCGRHKCIKPCHKGPCQSEGEICKQNCTKIRPMCSHKCMAPCHDGDCPEMPCKEMVEVTCECGNRKQMRTCHDFSSEYRRFVTAQLASSMQEMQRGNSIELSDIMGPMKLSNNKTLDCNEECKLIERNRRVSLALQIRNPDVPSKLLTKYSDFIRGWAKKDPQLVKMIHDKLTELVKLSKESKQRSRSHSFPTMNREKRQLVHEMCEMFGVESVAYDAEPNRNVVATAYRDKSWLPATSVMEIMQRESGQRRVPVPTNNVWKIKK